MLNKMKSLFFRRFMSQKSAGLQVEQRVQLGVHQAIAYAAERADQLESVNEKLMQHLPGFINAAATVPALSHKLLSSEKKMDAEIFSLWKSAELATSEIGGLWQRIEFVRNEILYEMRYAQSGNVGGHGSHYNQEARIINRAALDALPKGSVKINIGCGHVAIDGYINVDARELPGVDVVSDIAALPFEVGSLAEIHSTHVLEHFPEEHLRRLLPYWKSLLQTGGRFVAVVPDGEAMLSGVNDGSIPFTDFRAVLFGSQEYEGDFHFNMFTPESLVIMLREAGFTEVNLIEKARRNGNCFEFEIVAVA